MNGGEYEPSMSSGTIHHMLAAAQAASQPANIDHARLRRGPENPAKTSTSAAGTQAAAVPTALTAPVHSTARPDSRTARAANFQPTASGRRATASSGSRIHGASATGHASDEIAPRVVRMRGDSAYSSAARIREGRVPMPATSATR